MAITAFDSRLFAGLLGHEAMRAVFDDRALVARYLDVEVALARAEAEVGLIPADAAEAIARAADPDRIDIAALGRETEIVGYPIVGIVHQLARLAGEAGGYVHWGATTQDIMDTAVILQVRDGLALVEAEIERVRAALVGLAAKYRDTPMAGRTHLQHALPVTFGYKAAIWLSMLDRHATRLDELRPRVLVGQLAGAAGTLASLGEAGLAVEAAFVRQLGLGVSPAPWHAARDSMAEVIGFLGLVTGSLAKIATDVMLMMTTEIGEAFEPFVRGRGSSSTMPQKRNPISCEVIAAAAKLVRRNAGVMLDAMASDFERATGPWHLEWVAIPESFVAAAGALRHAGDMLEGLTVDTERMRRNLDATGGLIVAEAIMMALARHVGRQRAHDLVYDACREVLEGRSGLLAALEAMPEVAAALDRTALARLVDPANYVGCAPDIVDRVLAGRPGSTH
ncbi:MAG: adenylosuccinate lyase family protein [Hyphomicrobiaceae bacterium]